MANEVKLPQLGQTMEEGTVVGCLVKVGDEVKKGDVIFEVETDKATLEMESPANGFVKHIVCKAGQTLEVNSLMMVLGGKDEQVSAPGGTEDASSKEESPAGEVQSRQGDLPSTATVVKLPQLGQTMEEGTVVSCLVKIGDEIKKGDVIFEVETDKATLEMESPAGGFVKQILAKDGQTLEVNAPMLIVGAEHGEINIELQESAGKTEQQTNPPSSVAAPAEAPVEPAAAEKTGRIFASPRAKAKAKKLGIELSTITGTGPGGRIVETDVSAAGPSAKAKVQQPQPKYKLGQRVPLNRLGKIIAQRMLQSKREIPCFYLNIKVDVTNMVKVRAELNKNGNVKVAFNDFIMRALTLGIQHYPIMTGQIDGDNIQLSDSIGIGLAISVPDGLVAPIVKDTGSKTLTEIAAYSKALIERTQNNKLSPDDLAGGCITLSNLGAMNIDSFIPIVVPGQCSILGVGKITDTCVPSDGGILVRKMMNMTLSVDHKVANGAEAAQFLDFVAKLLAEPEKLI